METGPGEDEGVGRKWENIKRGKAKLDQQRGAVFSRIAKDVMKAAREGGPDPEANIRLKAAVLKAREVNMPSDNVQRAIAKGAGLVEGVRYEHVVYEGYGPGGIAVLLHIVTDNRNRTAADVRSYFTKCGGSLGEAGCVAWMFNRQGVTLIDRARTAVSEDDLLALALEAGADDLRAADDQWELTTAPEALDDVLRALEAASVPMVRAEVDMVPSNTVPIAGENLEKLEKLLGLLEEHDDVQNVYTNAEFPDEE
jgi:YebC/PmpR family DNA-binding regulatory protein